MMFSPILEAKAIDEMTPQVKPQLFGAFTRVKQAKREMLLNKTLAKKDDDNGML